MAFTQAPTSVVLTDAKGFEINLGAGSGPFTQSPLSVTVTDKNGNGVTVGTGLSSSAYPLLAPDGTNAAPSYAFASQPGLGWYQPSALRVSLAAGSSERFAIIGGNGTITPSTGVYGWGPLTYLDGQVGDTGISRISAGVVAIGNGTAQNTTGNLQLNQITKYNGVATAGVGVPSLVAIVDLTAQAANVGITNLVASVPVNGFYRASAFSKVTQAATTSSTQPAIAINFADPDGTALTVNLASGNTGNSLTTYEQGTGEFYAKAGTAITYNTSGYASAGATAMQYNLHIRLESL